jgi:hypothetical protein
MATRTLTYKVCDGCHLNDAQPNPVEIVSTHTVPGVCGPDRTVDICADCDQAGKFFCHLCARVHDDDNPCDAILRRIERAEVCE